MRIRSRAAILALLATLAGEQVRAQLETSLVHPRASTLVELSGQVPSACFTGRLDVVVDGFTIALVAEEGCGPCAELGDLLVPFKRLIPALAEGTYTVILRSRLAPGCDGTAVEIDRRSLTILPGQISLHIEPAEPREGEAVLVVLSSACFGDSFQLLSSEGRVRRIVREPTSIGTPPPCEEAPIYSQVTFSLGTLAAGAHAVLVVDAAPELAAIYAASSFLVHPANSQQLLLQGDRFRVRAVWSTPDGALGSAGALPLGSDSGAFWFFRPGNLELLVKVLDGCAVNGRFWVLAGGLTDVGVELEVEDTATGQIWTRAHPAGIPFVPVQDTGAFICP